MTIDFAGWVPWLAFCAIVVLDLTMRVVSLIVVPKNRRPASGMAWLLAIFLLPVVGIFFYWLIGNPRLPKLRRAKQAFVDRYIRESTYGDAKVTDHRTWPAWLDGVVAMNRGLGSMPLVGLNEARLISDYQESIDAMIHEINQAKTSVRVEFYIAAYDSTTAPFFDALRNAVSRGVEVSFLYDHVASFRVRGYRKTLRELRASGVSWQPMLPLLPFQGKWQRPDLRNHRKIVVIDSKIGFIGSQNLIEPGYHKKASIKRNLQWKDLVARVEGPIVLGLDAIFATDWYLETDEIPQRADPHLPLPLASGDLDCQLLPSGPGYRNENNLNLFLALFYGAKERIIISSPYFVPDDAMLYAITGAAQRGVHIELFVSEVGDQAVVYHAQRSYYEALLRAGVKIFLYREPTILHAKHVTVDEDVAVIGSSNMDIRSFVLNMEVSLLVHGSTFVSDLRSIEDSYRANSRELTLDEWLQQPFRSTVLDNLARLTSALQ